MSHKLCSWLAAAVPGLHRPSSSDPQLTDSLHRPVLRLGDDARLTGEDGARRCFGIDHIGLAAATTVLPIRTVDLDHSHPSRREMAGHTSTPRPAAPTPTDPSSP